VRLAVLLALPLLATALLGVGAPALGRRLHPASVVRLLPVAGVVGAATSGFSLSVVALVLLGHAADVAALGHWSARSLPGPGLPWAWGLPVAVVVAALLLASTAHVARVLAQLWRAELACRDLGGPRSGAVVVVDAPAADAYAIPGVRGRVLVSTGMLAALDPVERRALLAHERSHLAHRHHLWIQAAEVARVANPLLRALPGLVRSACEQEADLDAARSVRSPQVTARALARAALARGTRTPPPGLAATGADVAERIETLLAPAPRHPRGAVAALLAAAVLATLVVSLVSADVTEDSFERAQAAAAGAGVEPHRPPPRSPS